MDSSELPQARPITLHVNGRSCTGMAEPRVHLADFLRGELKMTGTHVGCEHGVCGACTVIADGLVIGDRVVVEGAYVLKAQMLKAQLGEGHGH